MAAARYSNAMYLYTAKSLLGKTHLKLWSKNLIHYKERKY